MLVSKINLFSNSMNTKSNSQQRTNMTSTNSMNIQDSVSFGIKTPKRFVPEELIPLANRVVGLYKLKERPIIDAIWVISNTKSSEAEKNIARTIRDGGAKLSVPIQVTGKRNPKLCTAEVGQYFGRNELAFDLGSKRYKIALVDGKVTKESEFNVQKLNKKGYPVDFIPLRTNEEYSGATATAKTLLEALGTI